MKPCKWRPPLRAWSNSHDFVSLSWDFVAAKARGVRRGSVRDGSRCGRGNGCFRWAHGAQTDTARMISEQLSLLIISGGELGNTISLNSDGALARGLGETRVDFQESRCIPVRLFSEKTASFSNFSQKQARFGSFLCLTGFAESRFVCCTPGESGLTDTPRTAVDGETEPCEFCRTFLRLLSLYSYVVELRFRASVIRNTLPNETKSL